MIKQGKKPIEEDQLKQFRFDAEDQIKYIEFILDNDPITANFLLNNKASTLTELFFDIRQLWTPAPKQRLAKIKELSPELYSLLEEFYDENVFREKLQTAKQIVPIIFKI